MYKNIIALFVFICLFSLYGCGGGSSGQQSNASNSIVQTSTQSSAPIESTSTSTSTSSASSNVPLQSTALITQYFENYHVQQMNLFNNDEQSLSNKLSASGQLNSGNHYAKSQINYQNRIDDFNNAALLYVQQTAKSMQINKAEITSLLNKYMTNDNIYANTYYSSVGWGLSSSGLTTFINSVQKGVTDSYSLTSLSVQII